MVCVVCDDVVAVCVGFVCEEGVLCVQLGVFHLSAGVCLWSK